MTRILTLAAALLLATGCATQGDPKPAVCDGKHRRPANPYGSVLPQIPAPASPSARTPTSIKPPIGGVTPAPGPQSAIDPKSIQPCGEGA